MAEGREKIKLQSVNMQPILCLLCLGGGDRKARNEVRIMQKCNLMQHALIGKP
jgi:hypothetical protein